jgi:hypothetical protein
VTDPSYRPEFGEKENDSKLGAPSNETVFSFDFEVKKVGMVHLLSQGKYRLKLQIGSANSKPITKTLEINLTGKWFDDEKRMLSEGIGIRIL